MSCPRLTPFCPIFFVGFLALPVCERKRIVSKISVEYAGFVFVFIVKFGDKRTELLQIFYCHSYFACELGHEEFAYLHSRSFARQCIADIFLFRHSSPAKLTHAVNMQLPDVGVSVRSVVNYERVYVVRVEAVHSLEKGLRANYNLLHVLSLLWRSSRRSWR